MSDKAPLDRLVLAAVCCLIVQAHQAIAKGCSLLFNMTGLQQLLCALRQLQCSCTVAQSHTKHVLESSRAAAVVTVHCLCAIT